MAADPPASLRGVLDELIIAAHWRCPACNDLGLCDTTRPKRRYFRCYTCTIVRFDDCGRPRRAPLRWNRARRWMVGGSG